VYSASDGICIDMKKILIVGAGALPFAATGGLGDVLGSLPAAIASADSEMDVRVVMPLHSKVGPAFRQQMTKVAEFTVRLAWRCQYCGVYSLAKDGVIYYFIDNEFYFSRNKLYGEFDDAERYAFFCKAVMEMMPKIGFIPDILHANDWQGAMAVVYLKRKYNHYPTKAIYTIHNIEYQGVYGGEILSDVFDLDGYDWSTVELNGCINLMKGAICCCDLLTTVSERYAEEIRTPYFAFGLDKIISDFGYKTRGIVNGIDYDYYNPETDTVIAKNFCADCIAEGKEACINALREKLGLPVREDTPVISMISRLASHKGFDLVKHVIEDIVEDDVQFVLLGTGEAEYEEYFKALEYRYPEKVRTILEFNKDLSKEIYAGSDLFLMPSKSEPCGLSQMIASRYATVPIVRETGGLADTIHPYNPESGEGNGVTFATYNAHDMLDAVRRAVSIYRDKAQFEKLRYNAKTADFSWSASAKRYVDMYNELIG